MGMGGYYWNPQQVQAQPKVMNALTEDEIKQLQQTSNQFSLGLTEKESLQAACTHRVADGSHDSLVFDPVTGVARCTICGYEFRPVDENTDISEIKDSAEKIVDILQTIKLLYTDLPANAAREYFQIIPLIMKTPQLFEFAAKNFAKHEFNSWQYNNQNMGGIAMLQNLGAMFGGGQPMMGAQQPMMGQPMGGQFVGYPQAAPMGQPMMGAQVGANPFGFAGASQQPVNPGYQYQPGQVQQPVQPTVAAPVAAEAAPAQEAATETVTSKVTV
jgi:hypothetical protein